MIVRSLFKLTLDKSYLLKTPESTTFVNQVGKC